VADKPNEQGARQGFSYLIGLFPALKANGSWVHPVHMISYPLRTHKAAILLFKGHTWYLLLHFFFYFSKRGVKNNISMELL
jgi:hypothetical protein